MDATINDVMDPKSEPYQVVTVIVISANNNAPVLIVVGHQNLPVLLMIQPPVRLPRTPDMVAGMSIVPLVVALRAFTAWKNSGTKNMAPIKDAMSNKLTRKQGNKSRLRMRWPGANGCLATLISTKRNKAKKTGVRLSETMVMRLDHPRFGPESSPIKREMTAKTRVKAPRKSI
jgi:hypothetical protein